MVELVDTPDLGSGAVRCGGSSPLVRTTFSNFMKKPIHKMFFKIYAHVVKLVYTYDSGSYALGCGGSSPLVRTIEFNGK